MKKLLEKIKAMVSLATITTILTHVKDYKVVYGFLAGITAITGITFNADKVASSVVSAATMLESLLGVFAG